MKETIKIITPQFERTWKLEFDYIPITEEEFVECIKSVPKDILIGLGFGKWDTMNNVIKENSNKPVSQKISIPIMNAPGMNFETDIGRKHNPTELLEIDEDILLIPGEWYNVIPNGFILTGLSGQKVPFEKGKTDDDIRYGCLAWGITRPI